MQFGNYYLLRHYITQPQLAHKGSMAGNNLSDVKTFCEATKKLLLTTADVLLKPFAGGLLGSEETEGVWGDMANKRRRLPADSFSHYLASVKKE